MVGRQQPLVELGLLREWGSEMVIRDYMRVLRKRWLYVLLPTLFGAVLMGGLSLASQPTYIATSSVYFSMESATSANDLAQGANYTLQQLDSYAALATLPVVLNPVINQLQLNTSPKALAGAITATPAPSTVIVAVSVSDNSPAQAALISNAVANQLGVQVRKLAPTNAKGEAAVTATVVSPATEPSAPSSPKTTRNVGAGLLAGLLLGLLLAVVRELLDNRVRNLSAFPGLPPVASIAADKRGPQSTAHHPGP